jgi:hypothetical protein
MKTLALLPFVFCVACGGAPFSTDPSDMREPTSDAMQGTQEASSVDSGASDVQADSGNPNGLVHDCPAGYAWNGSACTMPYVGAWYDAGNVPIPCPVSLVEQCASIGDGCQETDAGAVCTH